MSTSLKSDRAEAVSTSRTTKDKDTEHARVDVSSTPSTNSSSSSPPLSQSRPAEHARIELDEAESTSSSGSSSDPSSSSSEDGTNASDQDSETHNPSDLKEPIMTTNGSQSADLNSRVSIFLSKLAAEPPVRNGDDDEIIEILDNDEGSDRENAHDGQLVEIDIALGVLSEQGSDAESDEGIRIVDDDDDSVEKSVDAEKQSMDGGVLAGLKSIAGQNRDTSKQQQRKAKRKIEEVG